MKSKVFPCLKVLTVFTLNSKSNLVWKMKIMTSKGTIYCTMEPKFNLFLELKLRFLLRRLEHLLFLFRLPKIHKEKLKEEITLLGELWIWKQQKFFIKQMTLASIKLQKMKFVSIIKSIMNITVKAASKLYVLFVWLEMAISPEINMI